MSRRQELCLQLLPTFATMVALIAVPSMPMAIAFGCALAAREWNQFQERKAEAAKKATELVADKALTEANRKFEQLSADVEKLKLALRIRTGV